MTYKARRYSAAAWSCSEFLGVGRSNSVVATILVKNLETLVSVSHSPCFKTPVAQYWGGRRHISGRKGGGWGDSVK